MNTLFKQHTILLATLAMATTSAAQGTAFTYQGQLKVAGTNYSGSAEFQPTLWNAAASGTQLAASTPASLIVAVSNGLFILPLEFGANFPGADRWLQLDVRTTPGPFSTLAPRQQLTPTPYAIMAGSASNVLGTVPAAQVSGALASTQLPANVVTNNGGVVSLTGTFTGNGAGLSNVNALSVGGVVASNLWRLTGNTVAPTSSSAAPTTQTWRSV